MQAEQKMQAFIRLKRPLEELPSDTLILNCSKRQKIESTDGGTGSISTILKFSGTQSSQNDDITRHVTSLKSDLKEKLFEKFRRNRDITQKLRDEAKEHSKNDRYKVVNCLRSNLSIDNSNNCVTVFDIELEQYVKKSESDQKYVYDIYYADAKMLEEVDDYEISIIPTSVIFDSDDVYDNDSDQDSDDSNAENYYANDYPDESDCESVNNDDIIESMKNCRIDDLSSSGDEFVHFGECKEEFVDELTEDSENAYKNFKKHYGGYNTSSSMSDASEENNGSDYD